MNRRHWLNQRDVGFLAKQHYERLIEPLRLVARQHGYALAVHGSLSRDIDLVAVPWTEEAVSGFGLMTALLAEVRRRNEGTATVYPEMPSEKPHGRLAWSIHLGGGPYLDISILPRQSGQ
jgi:hypothetical protein